MAPQARSLFGGDVPVLPSVLPHHLFIMAAASVSKQNEIYPLTKMATDGQVTKEEKTTDILSAEAAAATTTTSATQKTTSTDAVEDLEEEDDWIEERLIKEMDCSVQRQADGNGLTLKLLLKLEDEMNRQLCRTISEEQKGIDLATELVEFGLISELDRDKVAGTIQKCIQCPA